MKTIVGVKFKKPGKTYYFDPQNLKLEPGTKVIVETALGDEYGEIIIGNKAIQEESLNNPLKKVIRVATAKDTKSYEEYKQKEAEQFIRDSYNGSFMNFCKCFVRREMISTEEAEEIRKLLEENRL